MAFIDTRLNSRYRYGFTGGPGWNTLEFKLMSGRSRRSKGWAMPHHRYTADYATFNEAEKNEMLHAFMVAGGSFSAFRFKDWNDWQATNEPLGIGDGTSAPVQLVKTYTFGPTTFTRTITLPLNAVVYENGVPKAVTVDPLTGLVTPTTPWTLGATLSADFEFDVRVTFGADFNPFTSAASDVRECTVDLVEDFG